MRREPSRPDPPFDPAPEPHGWGDPPEHPAEDLQEAADIQATRRADRDPPPPLPPEELAFQLQMTGRLRPEGAT